MPPNSEYSSEYNLELDKAVKEIKKSKAKLVCIQLPDGLKPQSNKIADYLSEKTSAKIIIWAGSCFGACDVPLELQNAGVDLLIQWGHNAWKRGTVNENKKAQGKGTVKGVCK